MSAPSIDVQCRIVALNASFIHSFVHSPFITLPPHIVFQLDHFYHDFPFGSGIRALVFTPGNDESSERYQEVFFDNFNWGTIANALKWKAMEKTKVSGCVPIGT